MASPQQRIDAPHLKDSEKQDLKTYQNGAALPTQRLQDSHKMQSRRTWLLAFLMCSLAAMGIASVVAPRNAWQWPCLRAHEVEHGSVEPSRATFTESLKDVSPESLNELLQKFFPAKFQHGVFPSDAEAVREADPAMAPGVIQITKRDGTNSSTTETTTSTSSSESTPSTSITSATSTTPTATSTSTSTTTAASSPTTGSTSATSGTSSSHTSSTMITRTESSTSSTSPLSSSRRVTTYTSTDANGGVVVVTATTYVLAGADQTPSPTSTRPSGSLQTNAAPSGRGRNMGLEMVVGAVVGGALLA